MTIAPPSHTRSEITTDSWITPKWLLDRLGPFDLDPCACDPQPWPCAADQWTESGLIRPWHGFVWCNPPYGSQLGAWLNRCALHGNAIACVFARTETRAFFDNVWPFASALLFLRGRLTFYRPDGSKTRSGGNSGGPTVLIGYGAEAQRRLIKANDLGVIVRTVKSNHSGTAFSDLRRNT